MREVIAFHLERLERAGERIPTHAAEAKYVLV